jgi:hypothetical protein
MQLPQHEGGGQISPTQHSLWASDQELFSFLQLTRGATPERGGGQGSQAVRQAVSQAVSQAARQVVRQVVRQM